MSRLSSIITAATAQRLSADAVQKAAEHIKHSHSIVVNDNRDWSSQLELFNDDRTVAIQSLIVDSVPPRATSVSLLLSGGEDSAFMLCTLRNLLPNLQIHAFSAATKGNVSDIKRASFLCTQFECEHYIVTPDINSLENEIQRFLDLNGRLPQDPAQPLHSLLLKHSIELFPNNAVLDGQFCDTVLHSNPHNVLLAYYLKTLRVPAVFGRASNLLPALNRTMRRIRTSIHLFSSPTLAHFVLRSIRADEGPSSLSVTDDLIKSYGPQATLSALFFWTLIAERERDKYLSPRASMLLPFDSEKLFWLCAYSVENILIPPIRKAPIHYYLRDLMPEIFSRQATLPFEPI